MDNNIHSVDNLYCDNVPSLNLMSNKMIATDIATLKQALIREEQNSYILNEQWQSALSLNREYEKIITKDQQKNEELENKLKALQIQDDENIVYEVSEYEFNRANKYEQALRNIKKFVETFCGTVCQDYIGDVDCKASCNAKFITEPILDDINEVLGDE